jgi:predicted nucleotidyltransferase
VAELDIQGILEALAGEGVDFLLIGGVAVGFHGYVRATKDVDVVPPYEDLVELKKQAGRPEDLADLKRLSEARGEEP